MLFGIKRQNFRVPTGVTLEIFENFQAQLKGMDDATKYEQPSTTYDNNFLMRNPYLFLAFYFPLLFKYHVICLEGEG